MHLYIIEQAIAEYKPSKVISSSLNPSRSFNLGVHGISNNDKSLADVVSAYCISHNINHKVIHTSDKVRFNSRVKLKSFISSCVFEIMLFLYKQLVRFVRPYLYHPMILIT